jgi:hypothetical protein
MKAFGNFVEMEVELEEYSLDCITDYNQYIDLKPPEKLLKIKKKLLRSLSLNL